MGFNPKQFEKTKGYEPKVINYFNIQKIDEDDDYITIKSDENDSYFIRTNVFINFFLKNKVDLSFDEINFQFVIDVDDTPRTIKEYNSWNDKTVKNNMNGFEKEELIPGTYYQMDDKTEFLFLGTKYIVSWKINSKGEFQITKPVKKYLALMTYDVKDPHIYNKNLMDLNTAKNKKRKILKDLTGKRIDPDFLLNKFYYELNWIYMEDHKPYFKSLELSDLDMKGYNPKELKALSDKNDTSFFDLFHESKDYYMSHNVYISDDFLTDRSYSRQLSRSFIFDIDLKGRESQYFNSHSGRGLGAELTEYCSSNNNFRIVPDNYYMLEIRKGV